MLPCLATVVLLAAQASAQCSVASPHGCPREHALLQRKQQLTSLAAAEVGDPEPRVYAERSLVGDEGNTVEERFEVSLDGCKAACDAQPACRSFSYGHLSKACFLKDRAVTMQTPEKQHRDWDWHYKTYFPVDSGVMSPPTMAPWEWEGYDSGDAQRHDYAERTLVADEGREIYAKFPVTLDECKELCDRSSACRSFAFSAAQEACHLKDANITAADVARTPAKVDFKTYMKLSIPTTTTTTITTTTAATTTATTTTKAWLLTPGTWEKRVMEDGVLCWTDRTYVYGGVPGELAGATFFAGVHKTLPAGNYRLDAGGKGTVYAWSEQSLRHGGFDQLDGSWAQLPAGDFHWKYGGAKIRLSLWARAVSAGDALEIPITQTLVGGIGFQAA